MSYRTKTYIAADWTGDNDAIDQLYKWNGSDYWGLSFHDAHDLQQARDGSLNCSIKKSLNARLNISKTFILIVGKNTKAVRSGSCQYCDSYNALKGICVRGYPVDYRSYIEYECDKAVNDGIKVIVLYNAASVDKSKCPEAVNTTLPHIPMIKKVNGVYQWDYQSVKAAMKQ